MLIIGEGTLCLMDGADAAIRSGEMDAIKQISYTIKDIYNLPEGKRAELINGQIYMMAPLSTKHQKLISALHGKIYNYIESHNGNCEIIPAPFAVFLKDNDENESYVEPDISVICDPDKIDDKGCHGSPDWIIEIVSSSSRKMDYSRKQFLYLEAGVLEYWIVDPIKETILIYRQSEDWVPLFARFGEKVKSGIYDDLEIVIV